MSSVERFDSELRLHLFTVDDTALWEFRSRLNDDEFAIPDVADDEWETFHTILS